MPVCTKCNIDKPREEFHRKRKGSVAIRSTCKDCTNRDNRRWFYENREKRAYSINNWKERNRDKVRGYWKGFHQRNREYRNKIKLEHKRKNIDAYNRNTKRWKKGQGPEYNSWCAMWTRCTNERSDQYKNYGGRGIIVCEDWKSFKNFVRDVGRRPGPTYSIDRIDNNGNYEPGNVRWATPEQQANNTRVNRLIEINGECRTISEWCRVLNSKVSKETIRQRLKKGWAPIDAITTKTHIVVQDYCI